MTDIGEPRIIQGGMGVGISSWRLANAVSRLGQLGVVSGTALDSLLIRRLQAGDPGGHLARAMKAFPAPKTARRIYWKYFSAEGRATGTSFRRAPMLSLHPPTELNELLTIANFVEVFLAKEGHDGPVGINYLEKVQMATLGSLYGAMLAGVSYVLMGAGIPREIPGALDKLVRHEQAELRIPGGSEGGGFHSVFAPAEVMGDVFPPLTRPRFLAIVSSSALAQTLARKATGVVHGFVIEGASAGGHNAPPRGEVRRNERGEPVYGPKDEVNLAGVRSLGLPFWLAGSYGSTEGLQRALHLGAEGVQVGTPFALCSESALAEDLKIWLLRQVAEEKVDVFTDPTASPTGYPFKVAQVPGTLSDARVYEARPRRCDLGYLRRPFLEKDGSIGYRCPAEPVGAFVAKGGDPRETEGRKCLCNALLANAGLGQHQDEGYVERPLVTLGDDVNSVRQFMKPGDLSYTAADVLRHIHGGALRAEDGVLSDDETGPQRC